MSLQVTVIETSRSERRRPRWVSPQYPGQRGYMTESYRSFTKKPRLYISLQAEQNETIMENLENRRSRPKDLYRKAIPAILESLGLPAGTRASWSQQAGCGCGCSPGFVLDTPHSVTPADFHATVAVTEVADPAPAAPTKRRMRNYAAMLDANLITALEELTDGEGPAVDRCLERGSGDVERDRLECLRLAAERNLLVTA